MRTDCELLELAAKAAAYIIRIDSIDGGVLFQKDSADGRSDYSWNPLTDHGDRHHLLIDLKMTLAHEPSRGGWSVGAVVSDEFLWLAFNEDEARAILHAAAEIGASMP